MCVCVCVTQPHCITPTPRTSRKGGRLVIIPGPGNGGCPIGPRPPSAAAAPGVAGGVLPGGTVTGGRWTMCTSRGESGYDWGYTPNNVLNLKKYNGI